MRYVKIDEVFEVINKHAQGGMLRVTELTGFLSNLRCLNARTRKEHELAFYDEMREKASLEMDSLARERARLVNSGATEAMMEAHTEKEYVVENRLRLANDQFAVIAASDEVAQGDFFKSLNCPF